MFWIMYSIVIIFTISIWATNQTAIKANKNLILGVTLPYSELDNPQVTSLATKYKKSYNILCLLSLILGIPIIFLQDYVSLIMIYLFLWIFIFLYVNDRLYMFYFKKLLKLKKEKDWFVGGKHKINIDTKTSSIKHKMPLSKLYFIPSIIISITPVFISLIKKDEIFSNSLIFTITSLISILIFIYLHSAFSKTKTQVYSIDSKVNTACNYIHKGYWSTCWISLAFIQSIGMLFIYLNILSNSTNLLSILIIILMISGVFVILYTYNKVRERQNELIEVSKDLIYTDEDEYWEKGYYYNPNDKRAMVEKRIGYGLCYNMATTKGKIMTYGLSGGVCILVTFLLISFLKFDFSEFTLSLDNKVITIDAPAYEYKFNVEDIEEISLIDALPEKGIKTNGVGTKRYSLGNYNLKGYGKSKVYVYKENPPFILIKLKETYVFINGSSPEKTREYYEVLSNNQY